MKVSVVINTLDRADLLSVALESLEWVAYEPGFEVVVVGGPSDDATDEVLAGWSSRVKIGHTDQRNLAASRNVGIALAAGDIVAFLDDDAVPEAEWLAELTRAYDDDEVGAAGGWVLDHTGVAYQFRFQTLNRLGNVDPWSGSPANVLSYPGAWSIPSLLGANSSFRRSALEEIGGFDEEYDYFLDESDVLMRLVDRGYVVAQVAGAHVHHKYAPSAIRNADRFPRDRSSVLKNHAYFGLRHAREYLSDTELAAERAAFENAQRQEITRAVAAGQVEAEVLSAYQGYAAASVARGVAAAERAPHLADLSDPAPAFLPFVPKCATSTRRVVVASSRTDAVRTPSRARAASAEAIVHAVVPTDGHDNIDFRDGIWVHSVHVGDGAWSVAARAAVQGILQRFPAAVVDAAD